MMWNFKSAPKPVRVETGEDLVCDICSETIGTTRTDGSIEIAYMLPCAHTFGSLCILQWLQFSPQHDCPNCRRRMVHDGCGHIIMPHKLSTAPPSISASETPSHCIQCRGEGAVAVALRMEHERLQLQEGALEGLRTHLPRLFGSQAAITSRTVDQRISSLRKGFAVFQERTWRRFEDRERRQRW